MEIDQDLFDEEIKPDLTPLIDAIFLLLIFFMVSMVFARPEKLGVELAPAEHAQPTPQRQVRLSISARGELELMGERVEMANLGQALARHVTDRQEGRLIILVDRRAPHRFTLAAMEAAAQAGFGRIFLATRSRREGG